MNLATILQFNSDLIIVPYAENEYVKIPRGITVKYFQAIAAKKNIIAYHDTKELSKLNVVVTYTYDDFINQIRNKINSKFSLKMPSHVKDWSLIQREFLEHILRLK